MNLREYFKTRSIKNFAKQNNLSYPYLRQLVSGYRMPSKELAAKISAATGGEVTIMELLFPNGLPPVEPAAADHAKSSVRRKANCEDRHS